MSYQKHTWEHLERVTAEKMNNMEEGIAAADSAAAQAQETADEAVSRCLPTPTSADVGKVATVVGETGKGAVIVPDQTVGGGAEIPNANVSLFTVGAICVTTYDGADYVGTVIEYKGLPRLIINDDASLSLVDNVISLNTLDVDSHTISVNLAQTTPAWGMSAPSSGVLVVHDVEGTLDKTWQEIFDADACILRIATDAMYTQLLAFEVKQKGGTYSVKALDWDGEAHYEVVYTTSSADGYPTME